MIDSDDAATLEERADRPTLVVAHGFGTGLGIFFRNYEHLANHSGRRVFGIDWLGMGLSARPTHLPWHKQRETPANAATEEPVHWGTDEGSAAQVRETEEFFVDSLERWREAMGISKMVLLGHSFGGYMTALYALRYPERVEKLILASPMGVPEIPEGFLPWLDSNPDVNTPLVNDTDVDDATAESPSPPAKPAGPKPLFGSRQFMFKLVAYCWRSQSSPQWFVRNSGPLGSYLVNQYISRYEYLAKPERTALSDYLYHLATRPGSGEYSITILTHPFVIARNPLASRLHDLKVPTVFMYGETDWMDYRGAEAAAARMRVPTKIVHIGDAGHNLMVENPEDFNAFLIQEMKEGPHLSGQETPTEINGE
ncbi:Alpha/Beta hydrolase protein [Dimargaris cristalligena]|uniref:Alpha/Beta hydrolase protein n=1 Tax=Dimargaris cristalligena TaxID=215637 RepID=A0A4Q0A150_9FUNG|nr:Alpha/Beta hydrolase protein [Dimargaris cristalligena]|eukprot:RKP38860.1 Alpha/Beta hydrolase protein [Dimargaris cristalligena]